MRLNHLVVLTSMNARANSIAVIKNDKSVSIQLAHIIADVKLASNDL